MLSVVPGLIVTKGTIFNHLYHRTNHTLSPPQNTSFSQLNNLSNSQLSKFLSLSLSTLMASTAPLNGPANLENETGSSEVVGKNDLLIVGPGVLGRLVARIWREENPGCQIYGQTLTSDHHEELVELGIVPSLKGQNLPHRFPYVIFCAPPTRSSDYAADLREAALSWNGEGCFVFTSSSAPYDCADNGYCDEDTPVVSLGRSPRIDALLKAENVVLEHGGCVLRLVGLYKADRGPHSYWLNQGTSELRPDHILNLIHYEDAASLAMSILRKNLRGRVFLGCDNHPLSRQEIMDQVNKSGKFNKKFEAFTGVDGVLGKRLNNSKTRNELQWEAKYASFSQFLEEM